MKKSESLPSLPPTCLAVSSDETQIFLAGRQFLCKLSRQNLAVFRNIKTHFTAGSLAISPDGQTVFVGSDKGVRAFSAGDLAALKTFFPSEHVYCFAVLSDDLLALSVRKSLAKIELLSGESEKLKSPHSSFVSSMACWGGRLITASNDRLLVKFGPDFAVETQRELKFVPMTLLAKSEEGIFVGDLEGNVTRFEGERLSPISCWKAAQKTGIRLLGLGPGAEVFCSGVDGKLRREGKPEVALSKGFLAFFWVFSNGEVAFAGEKEPFTVLRPEPK